MSSKETVKKIFGIVFMKCPGRMPATPDQKAAFPFFRQIWESAFAEIPDNKLMESAAKWMTEKKTVFPGDCPFSQILAMCKPKTVETEGDCLELADEAVCKFGYMRAESALEWIREKSPLIAACVRRIGFREYCMSENPDVIRGQLRGIFKTEKARADATGQIAESANTMVGGRETTTLKIGDIAKKMIEDRKL